MVKETYHPNAYLTNLRNVRLGLKARTRILNSLENSAKNAGTIAKEADMPYSVVIHHLKLLYTGGVVDRRGPKPYVWRLTGAGQKRL
jgi:predicted transcriptional regulator